MAFNNDTRNSWLAWKAAPALCEDGLRVEAAYLLADVCDALHLTPRQTQPVMGSGFWLLEAPVSEPTDKEECS